MKNKTLTRIAVSSLITACLMVQPCYAAEATAETQTTEESDHHPEPAPDETATVQEGQGTHVTARQSQREEAYLEVLHHQRQPGLMRNFRAFCQALHFRQEMEPGPYMYVTWRKIPKEPSRMPECRQQV